MEKKAELIYLDSFKPNAVEKIFESGWLPSIIYKEKFHPTLLKYLSKEIKVITMAKSKTEAQHIGHIIAVLSVTDDYDEAVNFLDCYKTAYRNLDWDKINQIIAESFPAFIGYDAIATFTYPITALSRESLYTGRAVTNYGKELAADDYEIKLMFVKKGSL